MKTLHKRLLGLMSFTMAILLFSLLYFTSTDKIALMQKTMMINNLPDLQLSRRTRCKCMQLLTDIEEKILNSEDCSIDLIRFNMDCFQLPHFDPHISMRDLLDTYVHEPWIVDNHNFIIQFVLDLYYDSAILQRNQQSLLYHLLESKQIDKAIHIFSHMPNTWLSEKALNWTQAFKKFLNQIIVLRTASVKLYADDSKLGY